MLQGFRKRVQYTTGLRICPEVTLRFTDSQIEILHPKLVKLATYVHTRWIYTKVHLSYIIFYIYVIISFAVWGRGCSVAAATLQTAICSRCGLYVRRCRTEPARYHADPACALASDGLAGVATGSGSKVGVGRFFFYTGVGRLRERWKREVHRHRRWQNWRVCLHIFMGYGPKWHNLRSLGCQILILRVSWPQWHIGKSSRVIGVTLRKKIISTKRWKGRHSWTVTYSTTTCARESIVYRLYGEATERWLKAWRCRNN